MEAGPGKTRIAAVALLASLLGGMRPAAAGPPCTPVVRVSGESSLVGRVSALLRARRLALTGASSCGLVVATVATAGPDRRVRLTIVDPDGRRVERTAADVESAATAIESWARRDVGEPLLASRSLIGGARIAPDESPVVEDESESSRPHGLEAAVAADGGMSQDGAVWAGVQARGCGAVGPLCLGGMARYARDIAAAGDAALLESSRYGISLLVTADVPRRHGRLSWSPGAGVGQSSFHARRGADREDVTALVLRAHLSAGLELGASWSAAVELAAEHSPGANVRLGDERDDADDDDPLAGAPSWAGWLGLGIRYGGR